MGINWKKWGKVALGAIETALDIGGNALTGGAFSRVKDTVKRGLKIGKVATGAYKDYLDGGDFDFDGLSADIGDLKNGLAGAKAQIENQSKELKGAINDVKTELTDALKTQGAKFDEEIKNLDKKLATATGENKERIEKEVRERKKEIAKVRGEMQSAINKVNDNLNRVENQLRKELDEFRNEVNERFAQQEQKILNNKRKIEEERLQREEEIRETHSKIKLTNTNLENLRQEKSQLEDEFLNYKSSINQKTADTQQTVEDLEAEYQRKTKILEAKIEDNQEQLEEFNEQLTNTQREQAQSRLERQEIFEELQEQSDLLHFQKHQTNLVAQQMEEVSDEIHERMNKIGQDHNKLFTLATDTTQKVDHLTKEVKNIWSETEKLQEQVKKNKAELKKAQQEAKFANERLDNYIKAQKLLDTSAQELVFNKIQKSLELKAEETKLLATLNLLQETKKLIKPKQTQRNWKVGIKEGTEREMPRPEGMPLDPNSSWAKKYSKEQLREWGWDTRLLGDNESAPLTTPDKRKEEQIKADQTKNDQTEEENQEELFSEQLEAAKSEILTRLQEIQQEVKQNLASVEKQKSVSNSQPKVKKTPTNFAEELEQKLAESQENLIQDQQKDLEKDWESIQDLSEQVLQENPQEEQLELDINQKLEELTQQIQELEQNQAASQKQMSKWMLFVLIFLLEYVVYKKQGVLGLAVLNTLLLLVYNYREQLKQYAELWNKYLLIIGYVIGNTLAYSAPEQEKYKWPSVIAFNLIIVGIYAYTLYQNKQEQAKLEAEFQAKTAQICQEHQITSEEWKNANLQPNLLGDYSPFNNNFTQAKTQQLTNLQEIIQEQEIIQQKALELQQQSELLQRSAKIESNLKEIHANLGEAGITWTKIKEKYPEFTERSILLQELNSAERFLNKGETKELSQSFLTKLQRISIISSEETNLLSQLRLTLEQFVAISYWAYRFSKEEREYLSDNYANLSNEQQLSLLNSGLNSLGIDNPEKKEKFVELNHALYQEQQLFGLSTKEKENILKFIHSTINLTEEQKQALEEMGIKPYNANEWTVTEEQKDHLLDFGLNKLKLTEEQKKNLAEIHPDQFKTFSLTSDQKNILNSLAPLIREDKYSQESQELLKSLQLQPNVQTFLTQEEIIPEPHTAFGTPKSSYLPLKAKFLKGEQKTLRKIKEQEEKKLSEEQIKENKLSILESLMSFAEKQLTHEFFEPHGNLDYNLTLDQWVNQGILTNWQTDILLTCGFKTVPKYHFFELLIFCVEKFANQNWTEFLSENEDLEPEFEKYIENLKNQPITINNTIWEKYVSSQSKDQRETIQQLDLKKLIEEQINQRLGNWKPSEPKTEEVKVEDDVKKSEDTKNEEEPKPSTSRYDNLLDNLNKEDAERNKKKNERQAAKNKFEEAERQRREQKLAEKDQKLKEDEEKRQKEKELADQEEKKRREAEEARSKALQEEQTRIFSTKMKNIEEAKKRAEEALENQIKTNELAEKKKRDEIEKLEKENQAEQTRLANQAKLIEEEKQKKLAGVALEDQEQRQRIEREANAEKARVLQEANDKRRKNEEELKRKENELLRQQQAQQVELERLQKESDLQNRIAEETKRLGREQERILKANRDKESQLRAFRDSLWNEVKNYYWAGTEARDGTRSPQLTSGGYLRDWLNSYPNIQFNLVGGDQFSCNWTNNSWKTAMQAFYRTAGNTFVDQYQFQRLLNEKVRDLGFLN